jgi:Ca2+-binding RTX toxin-like protein
MFSESCRNLRALLRSAKRMNTGRRRRRSVFWRPVGESLESRIVLAGNVVASFNSASKTLTFNGDAAANSLVVFEDVAFNAFITGTSGTTINGAASKSIAQLTGGQIPLAIVINGGDGGDVLTFDSTNPFYFPGVMTINGGVGNDIVNIGTTFGQYVEFGALTINGDAGNDTIACKSDSSLESSSIAILNGGTGNDSYLFDTDAGLLPSRINDPAGIDTLSFAATTNRAVSMNLGSTAVQAVNVGLSLTLSANNSIEKLIGGSKDDRLTGNTLANTVTGNLGNDILIGGVGNDVLIGGPGNDVYTFDTDLALGTDTINESGGGVDTLDFSATTTRAVSVNLGNAVAQVVNVGLTLTLSANNTIENVIGGSLADTLTGNSLSNVVSGGPGADTISGGSGGKNILIGGLGADILNGSSSEDLLIGARYTLEKNVTALLSLRSEWISSSSYDTRVAHLLGTLGGGLNGSYVLKSTTVKEDSTRDRLLGSSGKDWYFRNNVGATVSKRDLVTDSGVDSVFTEISSWL